MNCFRKLSSLEDLASIQVAINLCQDTDFRSVALCLEKPTYGLYDDVVWGSGFVSCPEKYELLLSLKEAKRMREHRSFYDLKHVYMTWMDSEVEQWQDSIDQLCGRLTEGLSRCFKRGITVWMHRIALEYLVSAWRLEALFGVSRYSLMNVLSREDWTEDGQLDERNLVERMLRGTLLTVWQRYRMACVYCMVEDIPVLWEKLSPEEKELVSEVDPDDCVEKNRLVLLWSYYINGQDDEVTGQENYLWNYVVEHAAHYGFPSVLRSSWKELEDHERQQMVVPVALQVLEAWGEVQSKWLWEHWGKKLILKTMPPVACEPTESFSLPARYSKIMCFFLSEMSKEQFSEFFSEAIEDGFNSSPLGCFLDWPHEEDLIPFVNQLWTMLPKDLYGELLLSLTSKHCDESYELPMDSLLYEGCNHYDYRSLLSALWNETPPEFKQFVFLDTDLDFLCHRPIQRTKGEVLLLRLVKRSPLQAQDEALFTRVWSDLRLLYPDKIAVMSGGTLRNICTIFLGNEKWSLTDRLIDDSVPDANIPAFKKKVLRSDYGHSLCIQKLEENCVKLVEDLMDWAFELDAEKAAFRTELMCGNFFCSSCVSSLEKAEFDKVDRMFDFCAPTHEVRRQMKVKFAKCVCYHVEADSIDFAMMDKVLTWTFDTRRQVQRFKNDLYSSRGVEIHYQLLFRLNYWRDALGFYVFFELSPGDIKRVKRETLLHTSVMRSVVSSARQKNFSRLFAPLQWCLPDLNAVNDFKKEVEKECLVQLLGGSARENFDYLVEELILSLKEENRANTGVPRIDQFHKLLLKSHAVPQRKQCLGSNSALREKHSSNSDECPEISGGKFYAVWKKR